ncbi:MAG TPA: phage holin family protein [bacterium]|jgi:putative membrane protein|nr:phage holin family protein [bacterium]HOA18638.1 phage holin family protein [bacterium]
MKLILRLVASTLSVFTAAYIIPGVTVDSWKTALIVALVLGFLNMFIKPILVILTLPVTILTLGVFYLLINALMVIITASLVSGFQVDSIVAALLFGILVSVVNSFLSSLAK